MWWLPSACAFSWSGAGRDFLRVGLSPVPWEEEKAYAKMSAALSSRIAREAVPRAVAKER